MAIRCKGRRPDPRVEPGAGRHIVETAGGHSERLLGKALQGRRSLVAIATKFGYRVDEEAREAWPYGATEEGSDPAPHVRENLEDSLRRLGTDYVDVYQLHIWGLELPRALAVREVLEALVREGKVRTYGWSTDRADAIEAFSTGPGCGVAQTQLNVMSGDPALAGLCERLHLADLNRSPLGMGILTGKYDASTRFAKDDVRGSATWFAGLVDGHPSAAWIESLARLREILTMGGRSLAQGALGWIWAMSGVTVPMPGIRTVAQAEENARAMELGPLPPEAMRQIEETLGRQAPPR